MNKRVLALSAALLFTSGAFAQNNGAATPPAAQSSMSATQNGTANNGTAMNGTSSNGMVQPAALNSTPDTKPMSYNYGQRGSGGWSWGWIGLFGLFGLLGMGGGRRRNRDVVATNNLPR